MLWILGFGVWGLGFGIWGLGFGVHISPNDWVVQFRGLDKGFEINHFLIGTRYQWFRGGLVFKAHSHVYHSILGIRGF